MMMMMHSPIDVFEKLYFIYFSIEEKYNFFLKKRREIDKGGQNGRGSGGWESLCILWKIINQCIFKPSKPI